MIYVDNTFLSVPKHLTPLSWPWHLTYFWKKNNLRHVYLKQYMHDFHNAGGYSLWQDFSVNTVTSTSTFVLLSEYT